MHRGMNFWPPIRRNPIQHRPKRYGYRPSLFPNFFPRTGPRPRKGLGLLRNILEIPQTAKHPRDCRARRIGRDSVHPARVTSPRCTGAPHPSCFARRVARTAPTRESTPARGGVVHAVALAMPAPDSERTSLQIVTSLDQNCFQETVGNGIRPLRDEVGESAILRTFLSDF